MGKEFHIFMVLAKNCQPCVKFHKNHYAKIEKAFGSEKISIIEIEYPRQLADEQYVQKAQSILNSNSHPQCFNIRWTPGIGVVTKESWDDKSSLLEGAVYGGNISIANGKNVYSRIKNKSMPIDAASIIAWIEKVTSTEGAFKSYREIKVTTKPSMQLWGGDNYGQQRLVFKPRDVTQ